MGVRKHQSTGQKLADIVGPHPQPYNAGTGVGLLKMQPHQWLWKRSPALHVL
jgi:hypothetical protein